MDFQFSYFHVSKTASLSFHDIGASQWFFFGGGGQQKDYCMTPLILFYSIEMLLLLLPLIVELHSTAGLSYFPSLVSWLMRPVCQLMTSSQAVCVNFSQKFPFWLCLSACMCETHMLNNIKMAPNQDSSYDWHHNNYIGRWGWNFTSGLDINFIIGCGDRFEIGGSMNKFKGMRAWKRPPLLLPHHIFFLDPLSYSLHFL